MTNPDLPGAGSDTEPGRQSATRPALPPVGRLLAVCAHPDDESFGLGALLSAFADAGTEVAVLCLTRGEASTVGTGRGDLAVLRATELRAAAEVLGVETATLLDHPDGRLAEVPLDELVRDVEAAAAAADAFLVFDEGGVTGHPDHRRATQAALAAAAGRAVLAWAVPAGVAEALNTELGTTFLGRTPDELHHELIVDRSRQLEAIACHASQATGNAVLWRRLELQGDREYLRVLG